MENLMKDVKKVLITNEEIENRISEIAEDITRDYKGKDLMLVGVLNGAMPFLCDLMRKVDLPLSVDTMVVSSYGAGTMSSGKVKISKEITKDIRGKDVLIVEDIIDTGITLSHVVPLLKEKGAASVELAVLLDKKARRQIDVDVKYRGFEIPDEFIVGFGCDFAEKYRNLPDVCVLKPEVYTHS